VRRRFLFLLFFTHSRTSPATDTPHPPRPPLPPLLFDYPLFHHAHLLPRPLRCGSRRRSGCSHRAPWQPSPRRHQLYVCPSFRPFSLFRRRCLIRFFRTAGQKKTGTVSNVVTSIKDSVCLASPLDLVDSSNSAGTDDSFFAGQQAREQHDHHDHQCRQGLCTFSLSIFLPSIQYLTFSSCRATPTTPARPPPLRSTRTPYTSVPFVIYYRLR
jgi:hypothetical protein